MGFMLSASEVLNMTRSNPHFANSNVAAGSSADWCPAITTAYFTTKLLASESSPAMAVATRRDSPSLGREPVQHQRPEQPGPHRPPR